MKLLIDMNLSPRWCEALAARGFESAHWSSLGAATAPDRAIMEYAGAGAWIIVTHDLDFGAILAATGTTSPSVVQLRGDDISPDAAADTVASALKQCVAELAAGALVTIDVSRFRATLLPLGR